MHRNAHRFGLSFCVILSLSPLLRADQSPDDRIASIVKSNPPRRAVVQLVEMVLNYEDSYPGNPNLLYKAIGEIGDENTVPPRKLPTNYY